MILFLIVAVSPVFRLSVKRCSPWAFSEQGSEAGSGPEGGTSDVVSTVVRDGDGASPALSASAAYAHSRGPGLRGWASALAGMQGPRGGVGWRSRPILVGVGN